MTNNRFLSTAVVGSVDLLFHDSALWTYQNNAYLGWLGFNTVKIFELIGFIILSEEDEWEKKVLLSRIVHYLYKILPTYIIIKNFWAHY